jgi:ABC-type glycerol-3-phosphate transport system permease component
LRSPDHYVISLAVKLFSNVKMTNYSAIMASSCISIIPLLVVLSVGQKYIIAGVTAGAVKG